MGLASQASRNVVSVERSIHEAVGMAPVATLRVGSGVCREPGAECGRDRQKQCFIEVRNCAERIPDQVAVVHVVYPWSIELPVQAISTDVTGEKIQR